jgi:hypothetical protein
MYNNNGVANAIKEMIKLTAPIMGLLVLVTIITSLKNYGLQFIDDGTDTMTSFLDDCLTKV